MKWEQLLTFSCCTLWSSESKTKEKFYKSTLPVPELDNIMYNVVIKTASIM